MPERCRVCPQGQPPARGRALPTTFADVHAAGPKLVIDAHLSLARPKRRSLTPDGGPSP